MFLKMNLAVNEKLKSLDNVIMTPHIASATRTARTEMAELVADNIIGVLDGDGAVTPVIVTPVR